MIGDLEVMAKWKAIDVDWAEVEGGGEQDNGKNMKVRDRKDKRQHSGLGVLLDVVRI